MPNMEYQLFWLGILALAASVVAQTTPTPPVSKCGLQYGSDVTMQNEPLQAFPGFGFDSLTNEQMATVFDMYSYNRCKLTSDRLHIIPDYVDAISVKQSTLDRFSSFYEDYSSYKSSQDLHYDFGVAVKFFGAGISASYSHDNQQTRQTMTATNTSIMQTSFSVHSYNLIAQPDAPLSPDFKGRIMEIVEAIRLNQTNLAQYLSQLLVRDFGTHVVTRVKVGAKITQQDFVDGSSFSSQSSQNSGMRAAAAAHFFSIFNFHASVSSNVSNSDKQAYSSLTKHSVLKTFGGLDATAITANSQKLFSISLDNLVALDRAGDPLWFHISQIQLPEVPMMVVLETSKYIQDAVEEYYEKNTVHGCTNPKATNFHYKANVDDGSCSLFFANFTFGGVYQTCTPGDGEDISICDEFTITNPLNDNSMGCPNGFKGQLLASDTAGIRRNNNGCGYQSYFCWTSGTHVCTKYVCQISWYERMIKYQTYWCFAYEQVPGQQGYMFGGAYMKGTLNPFTKQATCPPGSFQKIVLGAYDYEYTICVSNDYKNDMKNSIPFGGFLSSQNPSVTKCPSGYSPTLLFYTKSNYKIEYCVRSNTLNLPGIANVHRPPFMSVPNDNQTFNSIHSYSDGRMWLYNETTSKWHNTQDIHQNSTETLNRYIAQGNNTFQAQQEKNHG